jgi:hypothetical protein
MDNKIFLVLRSAGMYLIMGVMTWSCTSDQIGLPPLPEPPEQSYIGSAECATCHSEIYNTYLQTGHPYILSEPVNGGAPDYPFTMLDHLPEGYTWDDITYVVGGYNWKANYIDANGYLITGDDAQWNFETEESAAYHTDVAAGTKMYDCGRCHTTGWESVAEGGNPQNDLDGMGGSFFEAGVQCEQCHGQGALHQYSRSKDDIIVDASAESCGSCHSRNQDNTLSAMDGFISHYQQYSEMLAAGHSALSCNDCHDPHKTTEHDQMGGLVVTCTDCHDDVNNKHKDRGADCVTCHMPFASKSAVTRTKYQADMMTHIFKINTAADGNMFNQDGTIADGSDGVTLDLVCYRCHKDTNGEGGNDELPFTSVRTLEQLSEYATGYHEE